MKKFPVIFLFLVFASCSKYNNNRVLINHDAVNVEDTLRLYNKIQLPDSSKILTPLRIINLQDEYLIVSEQRREDFFKVFDILDKRFMYEWGSTGEGPDQFRMTPVYIEAAETDLVIYLGITQELQFVSVTDSGMVKKQTQSLSYEGQLEPLNKVRRISDSLYFADYGTSFEQTDYEHIALKPDDDSPLFYFGNYPETDAEGFARYVRFTKENAVKPDGSKFAAFYSTQNEFKIYNTENGELLTRVQISDNSVDQSEVNQSDRYLYRTTASASDDYIYVLSFNSPREKVFEGPEYISHSMLEVWDWNGNPVYRGAFDRLIHNFTISEQNSEIYAFSNESEEDILIYTIPEF